MGRLDGQVAIVTGASRGLGKAMAIAIGAEGASVAVAARTVEVWDKRLPGTIGETVAQIKDAGGQAVAIAADLMKPEDRIRLVDEARSALGSITLLVNNAAFTAPGGPSYVSSTATAKPAAKAQPVKTTTSARADWPTFLTTPLRAYQRHFEMVFAAYELMQLVTPDMEAAGRGSIINISSGASRMPGNGPYPDRSSGVLAGYGGSKAALEHLTQCCAYELTDKNITVNALSPSKAIVTPGVSYYSKDFADTAPEEDFAEAAIRLALVDINTTTGRTIGHSDVLNGSFTPYEWGGLNLEE